MSCSSVMFSLFLMSPCGNGGGADVSEAIEAAVSSPRRPASDVARDASRKPDKVLSFFSIKPGMTVLDLFSGSGYYTEMLNTIVGQEGRVIAHTNEAYLGFVGDAYEQRHANGRLTNTETMLSEVDDIELADDSLDAVMLVLTWHDFLFEDAANGWPAVNENGLISKLCAATRPGAVLGLIDHVANSGDQPSEVARTLHRIDPQVVIDAFDGTCFRLDAEADFLRNPEDDHTQSVFSEGLRGKTDRFVYRFVRN